MNRIIFTEEVLLDIDRLKKSGNKSRIKEIINLAFRASRAYSQRNS
jgi:hypothetical protein